MNKYSLLACSLLILTTCVGCYSHYNRFVNEPIEYYIEGGEPFDLNTSSFDDEDVGNEELVSFE
jgi:hypothetical protein